MKQIIVGTSTGAQSAAIIYENDLEGQTRRWAAGSYALDQLATAVLEGNEYIFRSKIDANTAPPTAADFASGGNWTFIGKTDSRIFATVDAAVASIGNAVVNGKNLRDGVVVLIGTAGNYAPYTWRGGFTDADIQAVYGAVSVRTGVQLFDKSKVIYDVAFNATNPDNETSNAGSIAIKNIPIDGDRRTVRVSGRVADRLIVPRDINGVKLPPIYGTTTYALGLPNDVYSLPRGTRRIDLMLQTGTANPVDLDLIQIEYGVEPTPVQPYTVLKYISTILGDELNYLNKASLETKQILSKNVLDYERDILFGSSMPNVEYTGQLDIVVKDVDSACTRIMPIPEGAEFVTLQGRLTNIRAFAFYDADEHIMPPVTGSLYWDVLANTTIPIPSDAKSLRFQTAFNNNTTWIDIAKLIMLEYSATASAFEPYSLSEVITKIDGKAIEGVPNSSDTDVTKFVNNAVSYFDDTMVFISRYSETENIRVVMKRHLLNNAFLIESIKLIPFTGSISVDDFSAAAVKVILDASLTDVISPYQVNDGYELTAAPFIGGNHGYGSVPTASLLYYELYADGARMEAGQYYDASVVTARTKQEVYLYSGQALPTPANDVVFNEYHNYTLRKFGQISVTVEIEMVKTIDFTLMYAIQGIQGGSDMGKIYVPKSGRNTIETFNTGINEAFGNYGANPLVDRAILLDDAELDGVAYWLDLSVGLGANKSVPPTAPAILKSPSNKLYHRTVDKSTPIATVAGQKLYYNGGFIPFKNLLPAPSIAYLQQDKSDTLLIFNFASVSATSTEHFIYNTEVVGKNISIISKDATLDISDVFASAKGLRIVSTGYGNAVLKIV